MSADQNIGSYSDGYEDGQEVEREACISILEDMRPRNDPSDWNEFTVTTDTILRLAIEAINRRYPA